MLKRFFLKRQAGFTLPELLVVMFIMGLLASMTLIKYRSGQKRYILAGEAQKLIANIRRMQNMAMSGTGIYGEYCGYGIEMSYTARPTSYRLFADKSSDCDTSNRKYDGSDDVIETVNLSNQIEIQSTSIVPPLDIFFMPPLPTTYISGDSSPGLSVSIVLEIKGTAITKTVEVTTAGLVQ